MGFGFTRRSSGASGGGTDPGAGYATLQDLNNAVSGLVDQGDLSALSTKVDGKAAQTDLTATNQAVAGKQAHDASLDAVAAQSAASAAWDFLYYSAAGTLARFAVGSWGRKLMALANPAANGVPYASDGNGTVGFIASGTAGRAVLASEQAADGRTALGAASQADMATVQTAIGATQPHDPALDAVVTQTNGSSTWDLLYYSAAGKLARFNVASWGRKLLVLATPAANQVPYASDANGTIGFLSTGTAGRAVMAAEAAADARTAIGAASTDDVNAAGASVASKQNHDPALDAVVTQTGASSTWDLLYYSAAGTLARFNVATWGRKLLALANPAANAVPYATDANGTVGFLASGTAGRAVLTSEATGDARTAIGAASQTDMAAAQTAIGANQTAIAGKQAHDASLDAVVTQSGASAAWDFLYYSAAGTLARFNVASWGRKLLALANPSANAIPYASDVNGTVGFLASGTAGRAVITSEATADARTAIGAASQTDMTAAQTAIGNNQTAIAGKQAHDASLDAVVTQSGASAAWDFLYYSAANTLARFNVATWGRRLLALANPAANAIPYASDANGTVGFLASGTAGRAVITSEATADARTAIGAASQTDMTAAQTAIGNNQTAIAGKQNHDASLDAVVTQTGNSSAWDFLYFSAAGALARFNVASWGRALLALANPAANAVPYATDGNGTIGFLASGTAGRAVLTSEATGDARTAIGAASQADMSAAQTAIGNNQTAIAGKQAASSKLDDVVTQGGASAAWDFLYYSAAGVLARFNVGTWGRKLLALANPAANSVPYTTDANGTVGYASISAPGMKLLGLGAPAANSLLFYADATGTPTAKSALAYGLNILAAAAPAAGGVPVTSDANGTVSFITSTTFGQKLLSLANPAVNAIPITTDAAGTVGTITAGAFGISLVGLAATAGAMPYCVDSTGTPGIVVSTTFGRGMLSLANPAAKSIPITTNGTGAVSTITTSAFAYSLLTASIPINGMPYAVDGSGTVGYVSTSAAGRALIAQGTIQTTNAFLGRGIGTMITTGSTAVPVTTTTAIANFSTTVSAIPGITENPPAALAAVAAGPVFQTGYGLYQVSGGIVCDTDGMNLMVVWSLVKASDGTTAVAQFTGGAAQVASYVQIPTGYANVAQVIPAPPPIMQNTTAAIELKMTVYASKACNISGVSLAIRQEG